MATGTRGVVYERFVKVTNHDNIKEIKYFQGKLTPFVFQIFVNIFLCLTYYQYFNIKAVSAYKFFCKAKIILALFI